MVLLKCQRCQYVWDYTGHRYFCASCPKCCTQVAIKKNTIKINQKKEV